MPDWNETSGSNRLIDSLPDGAQKPVQKSRLVFDINARKRHEINLGMAKNGAVELLKNNRWDDWTTQYKSTVRLLFLMNEELDKEILEGKIEVKACH